MFYRSKQSAALPAYQKFLCQSVITFPPQRDHLLRGKPHWGNTTDSPVYGFIHLSFTVSMLLLLLLWSTLVQHDNECRETRQSGLWSVHLKLQTLRVYFLLFGLFFGHQKILGCYCIIGFGVTRSLITYGCNTQVSTYFWPWSMSRRSSCYFSPPPQPLFCYLCWLQCCNGSLILSGVTER